VSTITTALRDPKIRLPGMERDGQNEH